VYFIRIDVCSKDVPTQRDAGDNIGTSGTLAPQLVRKLKSLTSLSPNDFLKEFRLRKAIRLIEITMIKP
jgi:hypothetical protein